MHGFIGKLEDGTIATYQVLPWNCRAPHAGGGANNTHIAFEICEDNLKNADYFNKVYQEAIDLCVYLCKLYDLTEKDIICHYEGHQQGLASGHVDVTHWFPKHGKSMDTFRAAVKKELDTIDAITGTASTGSEKDEKIMWEFLMSKIDNEYGVAGLMGNIFAESGLKSNNLQNSCEKKLDYTDVTYTEAVDNRTYLNFVNDSAGYGLAQWTFWSRKEALLNYAKSINKSIGDYQMQLDFLYSEIKGNSGLFDNLKNATSVMEASTAVLYKYERPAVVINGTEEAKEETKKKRAEYGQKYYDKYSDRLSPALTRIAGNSRYDTAIAIADELKRILNIDKFDAIVLADGDNFADALSGNYLATKLHSPILLYGKNSMKCNAECIAENLKLDGVIYVLGGTAAIPETVEKELGEFTIKRLCGDDRFDTNLKILEEARVTGGEILVSTGQNFADSLSAAAIGLPMMIVDNVAQRLTYAQMRWLRGLYDAKFTIVGGTASVCEKFENELRKYGSVKRLCGDTREKTSVAVAEKYFANPECAILAYSRNFPDGLCGGTLANAMGAPMLLISTGVESAAAEYVTAQGVGKGIVLGGTSTLPNKCANAVFADNTKV